MRDQLSREIRHGRVTKEKAEALYLQYLNQCVNIEPFFNWLGSTKSGYDLFLKERIKFSRDRMASDRFIDIKAKDYFDSDFLSEDGVNPEKSFVLYYKGI